MSYTRSKIVNLDFFGRKWIIGLFAIGATSSLVLGSIWILGVVLSNPSCPDHAFRWIKHELTFTFCHLVFFPPAIACLLASRPLSYLQQTSRGFRISLRGSLGIMLLLAIFVVQEDFIPNNFEPYAVSESAAAEAGKRCKMFSLEKAIRDAKEGQAADRDVGQEDGPVMEDNLARNQEEYNRLRRRKDWSDAIARGNFVMWLKLVLNTFFFFAVILLVWSWALNFLLLMEGRWHRVERRYIPWKNLVVATTFFAPWIPLRLATDYYQNFGELGKGGQYAFAAIFVALVLLICFGFFRYHNNHAFRNRPLFYVIGALEVIIGLWTIFSIDAVVGLHRLLDAARAMPLFLVCLVALTFFLFIAFSTVIPPLRIRELNLPEKECGCLEAHGIKTSDDLITWRAEDLIKNVKGIGEKNVDLVKRTLHAWGLHLSDEP